MALSILSTPKKLVETSHIWQKADRSYAAADLTSRINSALLYYMSLNTVPSEIDEGEVRKYLSLRLLPDTTGIDLVDEHRSRFSGTGGVVHVRALSKKRWENEVYNQVVIRNLAMQSDDMPRKARSILNLDVSCTCPRSTLELSCTVSPYERELWSDYRIATDIPGPYVDTVLCRHAFIALDHLSIFHGTADFGIHSYSSHVIEFNRYVANYSVQKRLKVADYRMNQTFNDISQLLYKPIDKLVEPFKTLF